MPLPAEPTLTLVLDFAAVTVVTLVLLGAGLRRAGCSVPIYAGVASAWVALTGGLAAAGLLAHFDPPRLPVFLLLALAAVVWSVRSEVGECLARLPLGLIVGFQGFRVLVEFAIHRAALEGIAPVELSWSGWNFDIVTGLSALALAPFADRLPRAALHAWNALGVLLLAIVVGTALIAMPSPFQQLVTDPPNVWVAYFPFVWLPTVLVPAALLGHGILWRRLRDPAAG